ncbi:hypothetical protein KKC88_05745 [Patescibacteria group bacterium]|nr:hypothetical protein [Patescibacteria group bacterium]MBU1673625.1 hypothetical protein [Patescibacteria group bacterium]MBU1963887.1 hypothetical protein [Patescibacteria group bacterium]
MPYVLPNGFRDRLVMIQTALKAGHWEQAKQESARIAMMEAEVEITCLGKIWPQSCNPQGSRRLLQEIQSILMING